MSRIKVAGLLALFLSATPADARGASCPAASSGKPLSRVNVFDGPIADNFSLAPYTVRTAKGIEQTWQVASIYRAGRIVYLECAYDTQKLVVPVKQARACRYAERKGIKSLSCQ